MVQVQHMTNTPDDWTHEDSYSYSPSRYNVDEYNINCKKCGCELDRAGDRSGGIIWCPDCSVIVWSY